MWIESAEPSDPHPASIRPASLLHLRQGGLIPGHGPVPLILVNRPAARTVAPYGNQIIRKHCGLGSHFASLLFSPRYSVSATALLCCESCALYTSVTVPLRPASSKGRHASGFLSSSAK